MYKIEKDRVGNMDVYRLEFGGLVKADEMEQWIADSRSELSNCPSQFAVAVDMHDLKPLSKDAQDKMEEGQKLYKEKGMVRSAVLVPNALVKIQFERIAKESGIIEWERYFAADDPDWQNEMNRWVEKGVVN
ncbi:MAG: hypothetical protein JXR76_18875 [Deltaproteobacteria bacterium]|nr:hypothetical protein [Deltaproteobacteria bacterium]